MLREKTRRVTTITPSLRTLVDDMIETMYAENGVGIAANQVGEKLRVAYIEIPEELDEEGRVVEEFAKYVLINPPGCSTRRRSARWMRDASAHRAGAAR